MLVSPNYKQYIVPVLIWCSVVTVILGGVLVMSAWSSPEMTEVSKVFVGQESGLALGGPICMAH